MKSCIRRLFLVACAPLFALVLFYAVAFSMVILTEPKIVMEGEDWYKLLDTEFRYGLMFKNETPYQEPRPKLRDKGGR